MSQRQQIIFGIGMAGLIFASAFLIDCSLLRVSMWKSNAGQVSPLVMSENVQSPAAQPHYTD
jgi:hypothetical protein